MYHEQIPNSFLDDRHAKIFRKKYFGVWNILLRVSKSYEFMNT